MLLARAEGEGGVSALLLRDVAASVCARSSKSARRWRAIAAEIIALRYLV